MVKQPRSFFPAFDLLTLKDMAKKPSSLCDFITRCEAKIREGRGGDLIAELRKLNTAKIARQDRLPLANICRRVGQINLGLKILAPVVRADPKLREEPAGNGEKGEYAVLLMKNGSCPEAMRLLKEIDEDPDGKIQLQQAFCHIIQREPAAAAPLLRRYIAHCDWDYSKLIGQVNLASVLIDLGEVKEASSWIEKNIALCEHGGYHRLRANNLELRAQIRVAERDFRGAERDLNAAREILAEDAGTDLLMIRRWQAILRSLSAGDARFLHEFRVEAAQRQHWDSLRETDLYLLKVQYDVARHEHLFFGSPYADFRAHLAREVPVSLHRDVYFYGGSETAFFDVERGIFHGPEAGDFVPGGKSHQLLETLLRDFYRPVSLGGIFTALFPDEYYDVNSSPGRIHQVIRRTRAWIRDRALPFEIVETSGCYRLHVTGAYGFLVGKDRRPVDGNRLEWERFARSPAAAGDFVAQNIADVLGVSRTRSLELLKWAAQNSLVEKFGNNRATRYRLTDTDPQRIAG